MYVYENGKTFWKWADGTYERCHDDKFKGRKFSYKRCPFCGKLTSIHPLHWINHTKNHSKELSKSELLELRYKQLTVYYGIEKIFNLTEEEVEHIFHPDE